MDNEAINSLVIKRDRNFPNNKHRILEYINLAKIVSSYGVIALHLNKFWNFNSKKPQEWVIENFYQSLFYYSVPIFVLCIGATLLDFNERYGLLEYNKKRIVKVFIPLIGWNFVLYLFKAYILKNIDKIQLSFSSLWNYFFLSKLYIIFDSLHTFLLTYMLIPLLAFIEKSNKIRIYTYYFFLLLVTQAMIPYLITLFGKKLAWIYNLKIGYLIYIFAGYKYNIININKKYYFEFKLCLCIIFIIFFYNFSNILSFNNKQSNRVVHLKSNQKKNNKNAVLLMLPRHGNLGDQAITLGEVKFLKEIFINITMIYNLENYTKYIDNDTIIFLHGGGNVGWTYNYEEKNRREIIEAYPNNYIIILPQTIYFEESYKEQQLITSKIYSNHSKLIIITREKVSYDIANILFKKKKIILSPDIVTYLDDLININNITRKGALILFRNDTEKKLDNKFENEIICLLKKEYIKYDILDTSINHLFIRSIDESREKILILLKNISEHEIVVTDRLHGMIFCVITKTSCIIIKSYNHKISSSYEWFKHLDFIKMMDSNDINVFKKLIYYFKNKGTPNIYEKNIFENYYNIIRETILNLK